MHLSFLELPFCCFLAFSGDPTPTNTVTFSSDTSSLYTSLCYLDHLPASASAALPPHPRLQTSYPPSAHFVPSPSAPSLPPHVPSCFSIPLAFLSPPETLRVLQWNAGGLRARSTELHFISSRHIDFICMQKSNLNSSSSFRIPSFSALL